MSWRELLPNEVELVAKMVERGASKVGPVRNEWMSGILAAIWSNRLLVSYSRDGSFTACKIYHRDFHGLSVGVSRRSKQDRENPELGEILAFRRAARAAVEGLPDIAEEPKMDAADVPPPGRLRLYDPNGSVRDILATPGLCCSRLVDSFVAASGKPETYTSVEVKEGAKVFFYKDTRLPAEIYAENLKAIVKSYGPDSWAARQAGGGV